MKRPARLPLLSLGEGEPQSRGARPDRGILLASLILLLALSATVLGWYNARADARAANRERFQDCVDELLAIIGEAIVTRENIVRGGAALFRASDAVSADEWRDYVGSLALARDFPDITGMGYAPFLSRQELPELARVAKQQLVEDFRIYPPTRQDLLAPVLYVEPRDRLGRVRGFDLQSDLSIRLALEQARADATAVLTSPLDRSTKESPVEGESLMVYPVFTGRGEEAADGPNPHVIGFVFALLDLRRSIENTLGNRLNEFEIQIYDGADTSQPVYDSRSRAGHPGRHKASLTTLTSILAGGHDWTVRFSTLPHFEDRLRFNTEYVILGAGSAISLLLFTISLTLATTRHRANQMAREMTHAFVEERSRLQEITSTLGEGLYVQDASGTITFTNPAAEQILGYKPGELIGRRSTELLPPEVMAAGVGLNPHVFERRGGKSFPPEEAMFLHKNKTPIPVSVVSTSILRDGQPVGSVVAFRDISERRQAAVALRASQQFEALFQYSSDAQFLMDMDGRIIDANRVALESLGYRHEELVGMYPAKYVRWATIPPPGKTFATFFATLVPAQRVRGEAEHVRKDGTSFIAESAFSLVTIEDRRLILVSARDITERKEAERRIQQALDELERSRREVEEANRRLALSNEELQGLSRRDGLTAIANRRSFDEYIDLEWNRASRDHRPLSLLISDVDHFKKFNDRYGHQAGDECLRRVAATLDRQLSRSIDMVARYGGEEFVVVLPETPLAGAINIADRLRRAVEELNIPHEASAVADHVTISVGVAAVVPTPGDSRDALLSAADAALYQAKQTGRNRVCSATMRDA
jgi:diguanylate cyclase (GGDEF)-like protein/PAS domain S-box-containing protein